MVGYQNNVYRLLEGYFKTIRIIFLYQIQNKFVPKGESFCTVALLGTGGGVEWGLGKELIKMVNLACQNRYFVIK